MDYSSLPKTHHRSSRRYAGARHVQPAGGAIALHSLTSNNSSTSCRRHAVSTSSIRGDVGVSYPHDVQAVASASQARPLSPTGPSTLASVESASSRSNRSRRSSSSSRSSTSNPGNSDSDSQCVGGFGGGQGPGGGGRGSNNNSTREPTPSWDGNNGNQHHRKSPQAIIAAAILAAASLFGWLASAAAAAAAVLNQTSVSWQQGHGQAVTAGQLTTDGQQEQRQQQQHRRQQLQQQQEEQDLQDAAAGAQRQQAAGGVREPSAQQAPPQSSGTEVSESIPKRIVLFIEPSPFTYMSGYQTRFLATIKELTAAGCDVLVVTPGRGAGGLLPGGEAQPSEFAGAKVVEAGSFPCPGYGSVQLSLGLSPRIFHEVRDWRPDIIHVTSPGALPAAAWLYSRILQVPLVASYHTHVPSYLPRLGMNWLACGVWGVIRAIHRSAHLTIAVSPVTATDLVNAGACDRKAVKVWPKAVDCERFHPQRASSSMRARLAGGASNADEPLLLYVGRVSPEKNVQLLLSVLQQVPKARLAIVGDGPSLEDMKAHFRGTKTVFTGKLTGTDLAAAYASADVFVLPSETETLGNVVGEAMASGLPVVVAAAGGVPSFISRPGKTGMMFPPGDATTAAAQIKGLLANPKARHNMSVAARAEMEQCSWRSATREILQNQYTAAMVANKAGGSQHQRQQQIMSNLASV